MKLGKKEIHIFIQKMMDKVVQFYYEHVKEEYKGIGYDTEEEAFYRAYSVVADTAFVTADLENDKLFLYALDPHFFIHYNSLWDYLSNWAKTTYNITLTISMFEINNPTGEYIYKDTKNYLTETKRMVDDTVMTFCSAFDII